PATNEARKRTEGDTEYEFVSPVDSIVLSYLDNGSMKYLHVNSRAACASEFKVVAFYNAKANTIEIAEVNKDGGTKCFCYYDVESTINNLSPGKYRVRIHKFWDSPMSSFMLQEITTDFLTDETLNLILETEIEFKDGMNVTYLISEQPSTPKLEARLVNTPECKNASFVREVSPATNEARKRTEGDTEYEFVSPVDSIVLSYLDNGSMKYLHINSSASCESEFKVVALYNTETNTIEIAEVNKDGGTNCFCYYDVESTIDNLSSGKYRVRIHKFWDSPMSSFMLPDITTDFLADETSNLILETEIEFKDGMNVSYKIGEEK
ncbi:MAG: hypothetical protein J6Y15_01810, partial [Bacteroidaceae bacterium]|nr:hypothetical protein [Bacteroidaceae bacterium]